MASSVPDSPRSKATRLARQLALAYLVDRLVEDGTLRAYAEAADYARRRRAWRAAAAAASPLPSSTSDAGSGTGAQSGN